MDKKKPNNKKIRQEKYGKVLANIKPDVQNHKVLKHLISRGKINTYEAFDLYRITKLNSRIHDLRTLNVGIETVRLPDGDNGTRRFEYRMVV